jgi:hypothetical protein
LIFKRLFLIGIVVLWLCFLTLCFLVLREDCAHTYYHLISESGDNLPLLTVKVSLPILGPDRLDQSYEWIFYFFWGYLFLFPVVVAVFVWRIKDAFRMVEFWVYAMSLYLVFLLGSAVIVGYGLWLPFSLM